MIALLLQVLSPPGVAPQEEPTHLEKWESRLCKLLKGHSRPIVIEVEPKEVPIPTEPNDRLGDQRRALVLSWLLDRELKSLGECIVLQRRSDKGSEFGSNTSSALTKMLVDAPAETIAAMATGVSFWELDPSIQGVLGSLANLNGGILGLLMNGEPVEVQIELAPVVRVESKTGISFATARTNQAPNHSSKIRSSSKSLTVRSPDLVRAPLALNVSPGKVMSVAQLIALYQRAYQATVQGDVKVLDEKVFVQGSFAKEEIEFVLLQIMTARTPSLASWSRKNRWAPLNSKLSEITNEFLKHHEGNEIDYSEFVNNGNVEYDKLLARFPNLKEDLIKGGYEPGGKVNVSMGVAVSLNGNRMAPSLFGTGTLNGRSLPFLEPNRIRFIITP